MTDDAITTRLKAIKRIADQSCSAHAHLRDRYAAQAFALDLIILSASAWTLTLSFADARIAALLTPFSLSPVIWTGLMGVAIFIATLAQLKLDLKGRSDAHKRACEAQAALKKAAGDAARLEGDPDRLVDVEAQLSLATLVGVAIPEREFVKLKRKHLQKVALSRHLDSQPFASPILVACAWWWRDNMGRAKVPSAEPPQASPKAEGALLAPRR